MASIRASGAQAATVGTEHDLATVTDPGTFVLVVDTANMVAGEVVELRIYAKARPGDTQRLAFVRSIPGGHFEPLVYSLPVVSPHYWRATLKQVSGTGRTFPWAVYAV